MKRSEVAPKYKWKLEDIYPSDGAWEQDFAGISKAAGEIAAYKGRIGTSGEEALKALNRYHEIERAVEKLYSYAHMRLDEDNANPKYQDMGARAGYLISVLLSESAFFEPELMSIPEETMKDYLEKTDGFSLYRFYLEDKLREKKHILSEKEERLLALAGETCDAPADIFKKFNNADLSFPYVKNDDGKRVKLTHGSYIMYLQSKNRNVRRGAFRAMYAAYAAYINTLAAAYAGNVKSDCFRAKARGYGSSIEAALSSDNVDLSVYNNLIDVIHDSLGILEKYLRLRKKALGVKTLHMYDIYTPIAEAPARRYSFEEAWEIVMEAIRPMGEEYCRIARTAFEGGWIDVCETEGKTSGAYSSGCYDSHPYILLNWQDTLDNVFTLAHELGHAMHTYFSNQNQPYLYAGYRILVAEVASTVNENLLVDYLLGKTANKAEKAYIINHYLEEFRGTIIRQTMFAEFERDAHALAEQGEALTARKLCDLYYGLNRKYFGSVVEVDEDIAYEWARIPHFYTSFYVYKYATGFSAAVVLAGNILSGDPALRGDYLSFLKSGGSDYPIELLKKAGVDLTSPEPVRKAMALFSEKLDQLAALL